MSRVAELVAIRGYDSVAAWLEASPNRTWVELGSELGVPPIWLMKELLSTGSRKVQLREAVYRSLLENFPSGWRPDADFKRAVLVSDVVVHFRLSESEQAYLQASLDACPEGWVPRSAADSELARIVGVMLGAAPQDEE